MDIWAFKALEDELRALRARKEALGITMEMLKSKTTNIPVTKLLEHREIVQKEIDIINKMEAAAYRGGPGSNLVN